MAGPDRLPVRGLLFVALGACLAAAGCGDDDSPSRPVVPVPQLDANYDPGAGANMVSAIGTTDKAVTFVVLQDGMLDHLELLVDCLNGAHPLLVDVRQTAGGVPVEIDADVLAAAVVAAPEQFSYKKWIPVDLVESGVHVTAGQVLTIACRSHGAWQWHGGGNDPCAESSSYFRNYSTGVDTWSEMVDCDHGFRVFVLPD